MREFITETFSNYSAMFIFFHVLGAIIWIGGMIAVRVAVHPSLQSIDDGKLKLGKTLEIVGRLFNLVLPFIFIILISAIFMAVGLGFKHSPLYPIVHVKEGIWTIMGANFTYMYIKRLKAKRLFDSGDLNATKEQVKRFANLLLPINIFLGLLALFFGITLRGF